VGWKSKRQQVVTRSTAASEYLAAATLVAEALWFKKLQQDLQLGGSSDSSMQLFSDNAAALSILHNPMQTKGTKHMTWRITLPESAPRQGKSPSTMCPQSAMWLM